MAEGKLVRSKMGDEDHLEFSRLKTRLGLSNDSRAVKDAVALAHLYLDEVQAKVPPWLWERFFDNLRYQKKPYIAVPKESGFEK